MTILHPFPQVSTDQFTFHASEKKFVAQASDLGWKADWPYRLGQVYDDACDQGFTMVSRRTGQEVVFAIDKQDIKDGDLRVIEFISVTPKHKGYRAIIFND